MVQVYQHRITARGAPWRSIESQRGKTVSSTVSNRPTSGSLRRILLGATALASAAAGGGAWAADADSAAAPTVSEIIVTAQRREERLQDVPISITAVSAADLARAHIDDASRLQLLTPGFTWGQQGSDSFPAIRGVRTSLVSAQNDPVIGFYLDGIYQSRTQQQSIPLFDLSRVEVQRGPQGTLYGRNTFGGNISVVTNEPGKDFGGDLNVEGGNYGLFRIDGAVNIPVNDTLQVRIAAVHAQHDGYVHSTTPGVVMDDEDESAGRISVKWTPTSKFEVLLRAGDWQKDDAGSGSYGYKVAGTLINPATGYQSVNGVPYAVNPSVGNANSVQPNSVYVQGVPIGIPVTGGAWTNDWSYQPFEHVVETYVSGAVSYDFGPAVLRSITGYTRFHAFRSADNDQSSAVFQAPAEGFGTGFQEPNTLDGAFSEEIQLASKPATRLQWIVGLYGLHDDIKESYAQEVTAPDPTVVSYVETTSLQTNAYAAYAQGSYFIVPEKLRIIAGIRYSEEKKKFGFADYFGGVPGTFDVGAPYSETAGDPKFTKTTYRGGVEFTPDHASTYYFTVSTGFESGGVNDTGGAASIPSSYAPQTVTAYEVGAKNRFLQGRVQTAVSLFDNEFNDLQINVYTPQVSYFGSAGKAYSRGAEAAVQTLPYPNLHVDATAAIMEAKYTRYISGNNFYGASNGEDPVSVNLAGKEIPQTPKFKSTLAVYYDFDLGAHGVVAPYISWLHSSSYYTTDFNTALDQQKAFDVVDLSLRWTAPGGKYFVEGFGDNVGNVPVLYSGVVGRDERIQVSYGPPAVYGVRLGAKF
jgi:iron complex outermembrane receptor protein